MFTLQTFASSELILYIYIYLYHVIQNNVSVAGVCLKLGNLRNMKINPFVLLEIPQIYGFFGVATPPEALGAISFPPKKNCIAVVTVFGE